MKVSEVTQTDVKDFCGISDNESDALLTIIMSAAAAFISGYTGLDADGIDTHEDLTSAYFVLINEMYSTREYTVNRATVNPCVTTILSMYQQNAVYAGEEAET